MNDTENIQGETMEAKLTNYFQRLQSEKESQRQKIVEDFYRETAYAAERAEEELPKIEGALDRVAEFKQRTFGNLKDDQLPRAFQNILASIAAQGKTPSIVRQALIDRQRAPVGMAPHLRAAAAAEIRTRLSFARGCAEAIERNLVRLKAEAEKYDQ